MNERVLNLLSMCLQAVEKGHHVFLDYSGHVKGVNFRAYKGGYKKGKGHDINLHFYTDDDTEENLQKIDTIEAYLKELLA
jgi:hypothetical protein